MGKAPGREGVGGETLMHQRQSAFKTRVAQVFIIGAKLRDEHHALVDDGAARHRHRIIFRHVATAQRIDCVRHALAGDEQAALELVLVLHVRAIADEHLTHERLNSLHGIAKIGAVDRRIAPANQTQAFFREHTLDDLLGLDAGARIARHEELTDAISLRRRQAEAQLCAFFNEEAMGNLHQNAASIPQLGVCADRAAMIEVEQNLQALLHDLMRLAVLDVGDEADAASVMAQRGVKQAAGGREGRVDNAGHGCNSRKIRACQCRGFRNLARAFETQIHASSVFGARVHSLPVALLRSSHRSRSDRD